MADVNKHTWSYKLLDYLHARIEYVVRFEPMLRRFIRAGYPGEPFI